MKKITAGVIAHVDAGKTTLTEAMLYEAGIIKKQGRVDKRDTFLDTHELERERGITIFSKMARMNIGESRIILLDTPGHVDFSAETERSLSVLDYAVLVVSGSEGVQAHTETLWQLLEKYKIPTFIFVTKMDLPGCDKNTVYSGLVSSFGDGAVDFAADDRDEKIAVLDERLLDGYMESGKISGEDIARLITERRLFPCFFGSGLKLHGVDELLSALERYTVQPEYGEDFSAKVYKIGHDGTGNRLTYLKLTGGALSNRQVIEYTAGDEKLSEKINGIRLYSGAKFEAAEKAEPGEICAVTGLSKTYAGQLLGDCKTGEAEEPSLVPVMNYRLKLPKEVSPVLFLPKLRELEEEEPLLHIVWNERYGEIHAQIMGQVQTEVLKRLISDRYSVNVEFDEGRIMYRETVSGTAEGVGHFEPLRHYAEVHLKLEPLPRGQGLVFESACTVSAENALDLNWQRLILTHLEEKTHLGVLTGSPITDMKITLVSGRAHLKHTQGGDFREATYRALRQGLMTLREEGKTVLLEPYFAFKLELPGEFVGRAISDITARYGTVKEHTAHEDVSVLEGNAPVSELADYPAEVAAYTHGKGRLSFRVDGYYPCHNADKVISERQYDPTADIDNTPDSVFCAHGAGFVVPWQLVPQYMHLEMQPNDKGSPSEEAEPPRVIRENLNIDEKELEKIMEREFGPIKRPVYSDPKKPVIVNAKPNKTKKSLYIVDGYNVIFAWDELSAIAEYDLENARRQLCEILANYKAFTGRDIILVFDAYNVKGAVRRHIDYNGLSVVYTKEGELGDTYIEKLISDIGEDFSVRVITSDGLIQLQAVRSGVLRMSANEFRKEVTSRDAEIEKILKKLREKK